MNANGPGGVKAEKDIVFGRGGDTELRLDILRPPAGSEKRTAVVHVFGGAYTRGSKEDGYLTRNAQRLAERGYVGVAAAPRLPPRPRREVASPDPRPEGGHPLDARQRRLPGRRRGQDRHRRLLGGRPASAWLRRHGRHGPTGGGGGGGRRGA